MKIIIACILTIFTGATIYGQTITYDDFKEVIPYIQKEDFKAAFQKTSQLLNTTQNDSSDLRGIITYMNIFSAAGMVSQQQMSYDEFTVNADKYKGQYVVMPAHMCADSSQQGFNFLTFTNKNGQLQGMTVSANNKGTSILCFEYFEYAEPVNSADYIGKKVRCGGILQSVETNPNKSTIWISRLHISDAFARVTQ